MEEKIFLGFKIIINPDLLLEKNKVIITYNPKEVENFLEMLEKIEELLHLLELKEDLMSFTIDDINPFIGEN